MPNQIIIGKQFPKVVTPLILAAKKSLDIIVYDWRWYPDQIGTACQKFNQTIIQAAKRGVKVRAVTNTYETVRILKENKVSTKLWENSKTLHVKLMLIDGHTAILGSHNYTHNAFELNHELSVLLESEVFFAEFEQYFEEVWLL